jgi:hypothetical protein
MGINAWVIADQKPITAPTRAFVESARMSCHKPGFYELFRPPLGTAANLSA